MKLLPGLCPRMPWVAGCVLALLGCREPTKVTLDVLTSANCADVGTTSVTVGPAGGLESLAPTTATRTGCNNGAIGSVVLVPEHDPDSPLAFKVVTGIRKNSEDCKAPDYKGCIVARRSLAYVPHNPLTIHIQMELACVDVPCGPFETCKRGACVIAECSSDLNSCDDFGAAGAPQ